MLKYLDTKVVFAEVPDEITLAINISGCPCKCPDCHSKYLWEDIGNPLTIDAVESLLRKNLGVTCVAFMGGDNEPEEVRKVARLLSCNEEFTVKIAWYSGRTEVENPEILDELDYIKLGPFIKEFGPLNSPTTNQKFYKIEHSDGINPKLTDITSVFWKNTN